MRNTLKHIVSRTYKPLLQKYLAKTRVYRYNGLQLEIPPEVFHPGFFTSTGFLLKYLKKMELNGKSVLELGAGSGLIAMQAAKKGARVMASDINPVAIGFLQKNSKLNNSDITIIQSDLFQNIRPQVFDMIVINPPYYKKEPQQWIDHAWFCGKDGEYFDGLFQQLPSYMNASSEVIMVLCEGCDREMIMKMAANHGLQLNCEYTRQTLIERNFIYKIAFSHAGNTSS